MVDQTLAREDRMGSLKPTTRNHKDTDNRKLIASPPCPLVEDIKMISMLDPLRQLFKEDMAIMDTPEKRQSTGRHKHSLNEVPEVECKRRYLSDTRVVQSYLLSSTG
jgi:hypothetical protein